MNKSLLATVVSASLFLAGCSSSGDSSNGGPGDPVIPDIDGSPEWGLDIEAVIPDIDNSPEWGIDNKPVIPDIDNSPEWGIDAGPGEPVIPDLDDSPEWGIDAGPGEPAIPDIDNSPEWGLDAGNTPDWGVVDPDFGLPTASIPDRLPPIWGGPEMPEIDNSPTISHTISGSSIMSADMVQDGSRPLMENSGQAIDRSAIRDSIRSHLK